MKTTVKILVGAAMIGAASLSAQAGIRFGFSLGFPVVAAPVCVAPAPVVVAAPACPPPVYSTAYVVQPACPGPNYTWVAGYWSVNDCGRVWVPGAWTYQPHTVVVAQVGYGFGYGHDRDGWYRHGDGDRGHDRGHDRGGYDHGHGDYHR